MDPLLRRTALVLAAALAVLGLAAAPSRAEVIVKGTGEPAFTSSANNTQWVEWSNNGPYRIEFNHHVNGGAAVVDGPYQVNQTGSTSVNWSGIAGVALPLPEGSTYTICGFGRWADGTGMYFPDFSTSCGDADRRGLRASTTIDRTAPAIGVSLAAGAAATKNPALPLRIDFTDNLAGPFPANFLCLQYGGDPADLCNAAQGHKYVEQPACSQPLTANRLATAFECTLETGGGAGPAPDGPVHVCAMAADAAIPDNPGSADQRGSSTSANRSAPACDTIVLDRAAPLVAVTAQPGTTVAAGDLVSFAAQASDATSGLSGQYAWTWGDNTAGGSGASATHTFTAPGTYQVSVRTTDAAGNEAVAVKTITVTAGDTATPNPNPTPTPSPTAPPTGSASLAVSAPKAVKLAGNRRLPVTLTVDAPGAARLALVRGGRVVAQAGATLTPGANAARLKLSRKVKAGRHTLTVVFTPAGGRAVTRSRSVVLKGAAKAPKAARARAASRSRVAAASSSRRVLPDGGYDGPRTTRVVF